MRKFTITLCLLALTLGCGGAARAADDIEKKALVCTECHGADGVPVEPMAPIIWGQNEGYIYQQLRDFKLGNRKNELMSGVAVGLEKEDMLALAAYLSAKPWPQLNQPRAAADVAQRAATVIDSAVCKSCHLGEWQGASVTPRIGGQTLVYLQRTMTEFRDGKRANNPWMVALLKTYSDADIDALARYLAGQ